MTEKNTIYQELEELRLEVENLKKNKEVNAESTNNFVQAAEVTKDQIQTTIKDFLEKDNINDLVETLKKDYASISPITAISIFTLGVIFARALSRK